jgi:hypothetical protein
MQLESRRGIPRDVEKLLKLRCVHVNRAINKMNPPKKKALSDVMKAKILPRVCVNLDGVSDWILDLLITYTPMTLHYTPQTIKTHRLLQSQLAVSWQRILTQEL